MLLSIPEAPCTPKPPPHHLSWMFVSAYIWTSGSASFGHWSQHARLTEDAVQEKMESSFPGSGCSEAVPMLGARCLA